MSFLFIQYLPKPGACKHFTFINLIHESEKKIVTREARVFHNGSHNDLEDIIELK